MTHIDQGLTKVSQVEEFTNKSFTNPKMKVFRYRAPENMQRNRAFVPLVRSDIMFGMVQIIRQGGEQELHSHNALDGFWFVLNGKARFLGEGDVELATLEKHDGIFVPRNFLYWFEAVGDEPLELLQIEAIDKTVENKHYYSESTPVGVANVYKPDGELIGDGLRVE